MDWRVYREDISYYRELADWYNWLVSMHQRLIDYGMYQGGELEWPEAASLKELFEEHEGYVRGREFYNALANAMQKRVDKINIKSLFPAPPTVPHAVRDGGITDADIARAREYDIERLIEVNRAKKARCINPGHADNNPSMDIRNGFVYCYSCGFSGSAIDVAMIVWNVSFIEAVKRLI